MIREWVILGALAAFVVGGAGCASKADSNGDETHFEGCKVDADCHDGGANARCDRGHCTATAAGTGGAADGSGGAAGAGGSGGAPDGSGGAISAGGSAAQQAICAAIDRTSGDVDAATIQSIFGADSASCVLQASDYDRSCKVNDDCVDVGEGNACAVPCGVQCSSTAINKAALSAYQADYVRTPLGYCPPNLCGCPCTGFARCVAGTCQLTACGAPDDAGTAIDSGPP